MINFADGWGGHNNPDNFSQAADYEEMTLYDVIELSYDRLKETFSDNQKLISEIENTFKKVISDAKPVNGKSTLKLIEPKEKEDRLFMECILKAVRNKSMDEFWEIIQMDYKANVLDLPPRRQAIVANSIASLAISLRIEGMPEPDYLSMPPLPPPAP